MWEPFAIPIYNGVLEPFAVVFAGEGNYMTATCTCRPSALGIHCDHQLAILVGVTSAMQDDLMQEIASWQMALHCTNVVQRNIDIDKMIRAMNTSSEKRRSMRAALARAVSR